MKQLFSRIYHICFYVTDIKATLAFYRTCGFNVVKEMRVDPNAEPWNYLLQIGNGQYLELQPVNAKRPFFAPEKPTYKKDSCYAHFALLSANLKAAACRLRSAGIPLYSTPDGTEQITEEQLLKSEEWLYAWLLDPDKNPIEIMQEI